MKPLIESLPLMLKQSQNAANSKRSKTQIRGTQMTVRPDPHPVRDFFAADLVDYSPKDSSEMMERPFFAIGKRKRNKPIEYTSPDGSVWIQIVPNPLYGMATIWDADILIWCISQIMARKNDGDNQLSGTIRTTPYELLKGIARGTGGKNYADLMGAIDRLRTTQVRTNIRSGGARHVSFHYMGDMEGDGTRDKEDNTALRTLTLRVPEWLLEGVRKGKILTLDREYFLLTGGLERALYRTARKHAGNQKQGWTCRMSVLHAKTGAESDLKSFSYRLRKLCKKNDLPRYAMTEVVATNGEAAIHFIDREALGKGPSTKAQLKADEAQTRDAVRTVFIDNGYNPRDFQELWEALTSDGRSVTVDEFQKLYPPKG
jgi:plasmid replication initiation protein